MFGGTSRPGRDTNLADTDGRKVFNAGRTLTVNGQNCWSPTGHFVTASGQDLMAAAGQTARQLPRCCVRGHVKLLAGGQEKSSRW